MRLSPAHRVLLASPAYLETHPALRNPADLAEHPGILIRSPQRALLPTKTRVFVDFVVEHFRREQLARRFSGLP